MSNKERNNLIREAEAAGWIVDRTSKGHLRFVHPEASKFVVTAYTPSDWRSYKNARAAMKRALYSSTAAIRVPKGKNHDATQHRSRAGVRVGSGNASDDLVAAADLAAPREVPDRHSTVADDPQLRVGLVGGMCAADGGAFVGSGEQRHEEGISPVASAASRDTQTRQEDTTMDEENHPISFVTTVANDVLIGNTMIEKGSLLIIRNVGGEGYVGVVPNFAAQHGKIISGPSEDMEDVAMRIARMMMTDNGALRAVLDVGLRRLLGHKSGVEPEPRSRQKKKRGSRTGSSASRFHFSPAHGRIPRSLTDFPVGTNPTRKQHTESCDLMLKRVVEKALAGATFPSGVKGALSLIEFDETHSRRITVNGINNRLSRIVREGVLVVDDNGMCSIHSELVKPIQQGPVQLHRRTV